VALRMSGAAKRLACDDHRVARRRMHTTLDATDHPLRELRRFGRASLRTTARGRPRTVARGTAASGTTGSAGALRVVRVGTTQRLDEPLADDEQ
jgi:hypothetical protein